MDKFHGNWRCSFRMSRERLRLCCGIQCTDSLHPNGPRQRQKLFTAALKLLRFAIGIETVRCENEAQRALQLLILYRCRCLITFKTKWADWLGTMSKTARGLTLHCTYSLNRNQASCGGGFQQECSQQFSPVADWMSSVDLFLEDEGQQYDGRGGLSC